MKFTKTTQEQIDQTTKNKLLVQGEKQSLGYQILKVKESI